MKRIRKPMLLLMALTVLLSVPAFAADTGTGFYDISKETDVTVTPDGSGTANVVWGSDETGPMSSLYKDSGKMDVTVSNANDGEYLLLLTTADELGQINENNIYFIDQVTAQNKTAVFRNVYPKLLAEDGKTQKAYLFITSNADDFTAKKVTLNYANNAAYVEPPYILGDANSDSEVDSSDAVAILQYDVGLIDETMFNLAASEVTGDGEVDSSDAVAILQYDVNIISQFVVSN